jgi:hypothetical protein
MWKCGVRAGAAVVLQAGMVVKVLVVELVGIQRDL